MYRTRAAFLALSLWSCASAPTGKPDMAALGRWSLVEETPTERVSFDPEAVRPLGDGIYAAWFKEDYKDYHRDRKGDWLSQELLQYALDCSRGRIAVLTIVQRLDGAVVWRGDYSNDPEWKAVLPDSRGAVWHSKVCQAQRLKEVYAAINRYAGALGLGDELTKEVVVEVVRRLIARDPALRLNGVTDELLFRLVHEAASELEAAPNED